MITVKFANGQEISAYSVIEEKYVHVVPNYWTLRIISNENLTSSELDELITPENISHIEYEYGGETKVVTGYTQLDHISKTILETGINLNIILLKEETENES